MRRAELGAGEWYSNCDMCQLEEGGRGGGWSSNAPAGCSTCLLRRSAGGCGRLRGSRRGWRAAGRCAGGRSAGRAARWRRGGGPWAVRARVGLSSVTSRWRVDGVGFEFCMQKPGWVCDGVPKLGVDGAWDRSLGRKLYLGRDYYHC